MTRKIIFEAILATMLCIVSVLIRPESYPLLIIFYCFVILKMSNYHHTQIARLEDISHPPLIVNLKNNIRKHVQGYVTSYIS